MPTQEAKGRKRNLSIMRDQDVDYTFNPQVEEKIQMLGRYTHESRGFTEGI